MSTTELNTLIANNFIDTEEVDIARKQKVCLIVDIYKLEQLLEKKKSDFFLLYDYDTDVLIEYMRCLTELQLTKMRKHTMAKLDERVNRSPYKPY